MHFETAHMYFLKGMVLKSSNFSQLNDKIVPKLPNNKKLFNFVENWKRPIENFWYLKNANYKNYKKLKTKTV